MNARNLLGMALAVSVLTLAAPYPALAKYDWDKVAQALGEAGEMYPHDVYKVSLPRNDLELTLDGIHLNPTFLRGSWMSFQRHHGNATVDVDLALTYDEVQPVMEKLEDSGFEITSLHNHLTRIQPPILFLHAMAHGNAVGLAKALHEAIALSKTPFDGAASQAPVAVGGLASIDRIIGTTSRTRGGVMQYRIPRKDTIREHKQKLAPAMGSEIGINVQPLSDATVAATGDLALIASEVQPVLKALRENHIEVMALHNHMLEEQPRLFFLHFWAHGDAEAVAKGIHAALDKMHVSME